MSQHTRGESRRGADAGGGGAGTRASLLECVTDCRGPIVEQPWSAAADGALADLLEGSGPLAPKILAWFLVHRLESVTEREDRSAPRPAPLTATWRTVSRGCEQHTLYLALPDLVIALLRRRLSLREDESMRLRAAQGVTFLDRCEPVNMAYAGYAVATAASLTDVELAMGLDTLVALPPSKTVHTLMRAIADGLVALQRLDPLRRAAQAAATTLARALAADPPDFGGELPPFNVEETARLLRLFMCGDHSDPAAFHAAVPHLCAALPRLRGQDPRAFSALVLSCRAMLAVFDEACWASAQAPLRRALDGLGASGKPPPAAVHSEIIASSWARVADGSRVGEAGGSGEAARLGADRRPSWVEGPWQFAYLGTVSLRITRPRAAWRARACAWVDAPPVDGGFGPQHRTPLQHRVASEGVIVRNDEFGARGAAGWRLLAQPQDQGVGAEVMGEDAAPSEVRLNSSMTQMVGVAGADRNAVPVAAMRGLPMPAEDAEFSLPTCGAPWHATPYPSAAVPALRRLLRSAAAVGGEAEDPEPRAVAARRLIGAADSARFDIGRWLPWVPPQSVFGVSGDDSPAPVTPRWHARAGLASAQLMVPMPAWRAGDGSWPAVDGAGRVLAPAILTFGGMRSGKPSGDVLRFTPDGSAQVFFAPGVQSDDAPPTAISAAATSVQPCPLAPADDASSHDCLLIAGGVKADGAALSPCRLFDPWSGTWLAVHPASDGAASGDGEEPVCRRDHAGISIPPPGAGSSGIPAPSPAVRQVLLDNAQARLAFAAARSLALMHGGVTVEGGDDSPSLLGGGLWVHVAMGGDGRCVSDTSPLRPLPGPRPSPRRGHSAWAVDVTSASDLAGDRRRAPTVCTHVYVHGGRAADGRLLGDLWRLRVEVAAADAAGRPVLAEAEPGEAAGARLRWSCVRTGGWECINPGETYVPRTALAASCHPPPRSRSRAEGQDEKEEEKGEVKSGEGEEEEEAVRLLSRLPSPRARSHAAPTVAGGCLWLWGGVIAPPLEAAKPSSEGVWRSGALWRFVVAEERWEEVVSPVGQLSPASHATLAFLPACWPTATALGRHLRSDVHRERRRCAAWEASIPVHIPGPGVDGDGAGSAQGESPPRCVGALCRTETPLLQAKYVEEDDALFAGALMATGGLRLSRPGPTHQCALMFLPHTARCAEREGEAAPVLANSAAGHEGASGHCGEAKAHAPETGPAPLACLRSTLPHVNGSVWALCFDGACSSVCVGMAHCASFPRTAQFSVQAWICPTRVTGVPMAVVSKSNQGVPGGWSLRVEDGSLTFTRTGLTGPIAAVSDRRALRPGRWTHVAAVADGLTLRLLVNGRAVAEVESVKAPVETSVPVLIGAEHARMCAILNPFCGLVADVRVHAVGLRASEVEASSRALPSTSVCYPRTKEEAAELRGMVSASEGHGAAADLVQPPPKVDPIDSGLPSADPALIGAWPLLADGPDTVVAVDTSDSCAHGALQGGARWVPLPAADLPFAAAAGGADRMAVALTEAAEEAGRAEAVRATSATLSVVGGPLPASSRALVRELGASPRVLSLLLPSHVVPRAWAPLVKRCRGSDGVQAAEVATPHPIRLILSGHIQPESRGFLACRRERSVSAGHVFLARPIAVHGDGFDADLVVRHTTNRVLRSRSTVSIVLCTRDPAGELELSGSLLGVASPRNALGVALTWNKHSTRHADGCKLVLELFRFDAQGMYENVGTAPVCLTRVGVHRRICLRVSYRAKQRRLFMEAGDGAVVLDLPNFDLGRILYGDDGAAEGEGEGEGGVVQGGGERTGGGGAGAGGAGGSPVEETPSGSAEEGGASGEGDEGKDGGEGEGEEGNEARPEAEAEGEAVKASPQVFPEDVMTLTGRKARVKYRGGSAEEAPPLSGGASRAADGTLVDCVWVGACFISLAAKARGSIYMTDEHFEFALDRLTVHAPTTEGEDRLRPLPELEGSAADAEELAAVVQLPVSLCERTLQQFGRDKDGAAMYILSHHEELAREAERMRPSGGGEGGGDGGNGASGPAPGVRLPSPSLEASWALPGMHFGIEVLSRDARSNPACSLSAAAAAERDALWSTGNDAIPGQDPSQARAAAASWRWQPLWHPSQAPPLPAFEVEGAYHTGSTSGCIQGVMVRDPASQQWQLFAHAKHGGAARPAHVFLHFFPSADGSRLEASGEWRQQSPMAFTGYKRSDVRVRGAPFSGLRNLGNSCYMNSVLQVLGVTDAARAIIMRAQLPAPSPRTPPADAHAGGGEEKEGEVLEEGKEEGKEVAVAAVSPPAGGEVKVPASAASSSRSPRPPAAAAEAGLSDDLRQQLEAAGLDPEQVLAETRAVSAAGTGDAPAHASTTSPVSPLPAVEGDDADLPLAIDADAAGAARPGDDLTDPRTWQGVASTLQDILLRLRRSEQPVLNPAALRQWLPAMYRSSAQQDAAEFAGMLMELASKGIVRSHEAEGEEEEEGSQHAGLLRLFTGKLTSVLEALECDFSRSREEEFTPLALDLPSRMAPVTDVVVVHGSCSSLLAPEGYVKVHDDLLPGVDGHYAFLCYSRLAEPPLLAAEGRKQPHPSASPAHGASPVLRRRDGRSGPGSEPLLPVVGVELELVDAEAAAAEWSARCMYHLHPGQSPGALPPVVASHYPLPGTAVVMAVRLTRGRASPVGDVRVVTTEVGASPEAPLGATLVPLAANEGVTAGPATHIVHVPARLAISAVRVLDGTGRCLAHSLADAEGEDEGEGVVVASPTTFPPVAAAAEGEPMLPPPAASAGGAGHHAAPSPVPSVEEVGEDFERVEGELARSSDPPCADFFGAAMAHAAQVAAEGPSAGEGKTPGSGHALSPDCGGVPALVPFASTPRGADAGHGADESISARAGTRRLEVTRVASRDEVPVTDVRLCARGSEEARALAEAGYTELPLHFAGLDAGAGDVEADEDGTTLFALAGHGCPVTGLRWAAMRPVSGGAGRAGGAALVGGRQTLGADEQVVGEVFSSPAVPAECLPPGEAATAAFPHVGRWATDEQGPLLVRDLGPVTAFRCHGAYVEESMELIGVLTPPYTATPTFTHPLSRAAEAHASLAGVENQYVASPEEGATGARARPRRRPLPVWEMHGRRFGPKVVPRRCRMAFKDDASMFNGFISGSHAPLRWTGLKIEGGGGRDVEGVDPRLLGSWTTDEGDLVLQAESRLNARLVELEPYEQRGGYVQYAHGIAWEEEDGRWVVEGEVEVAGQEPAPLALTFAAQGATFEGRFTAGEREVPLTGRREAGQALIACHDTSEYWRHGRPLFSSTATDAGLPTLLRQLGNPEVMMGDNKYWCEERGVWTDAFRRSVISDLPSHLMITVKLFRFDRETGAQVKRLDDVEVPALLEVPVDEHAGSAMSASSNGAQLRDSVSVRPYGLYAVVTHSGSSVHSGHYWVFGRRSGLGNVGLEDCPGNPWVKADDTKVTFVAYSDMRDHFRASRFDSPYIVLYRALSREEAKEAGASEAACRGASDVAEEGVGEAEDAEMVQASLMSESGRQALRRVMQDNEEALAAVEDVVQSPYWRRWRLLELGRGDDAARAVAADRTPIL